MTTSAPVTPERIMQFAWGYVPPLVLEAAVRHRVFDVLDSGPKTIAQVQKETGASERGLTAVMHALVGMNSWQKISRACSRSRRRVLHFWSAPSPAFKGGLLRHGSEQLIPKWLHLNKIVEDRTACGVRQPRRGRRRFLPAVRGGYLSLELSGGADTQQAFEC